MFVLKKTYNELKEEFDYKCRLFNKLADEYNSLVDKYNSDRRAFLRLSNNQFGEDDIKKMLLLCHPDKHGGKQIAIEVTQKLLAMRGK